MGNDALSADTSTALADVDYPAIQQSPEFQTLRRTHRGFVFPVLAACLVWYFAYVLLASYAHDFMSTPVFGSVNVAMVLGIRDRGGEPLMTQIQTQTHLAAEAAVRTAKGLELW